MYVLFFQTLFAHACLPALRIFLQPVFYLGTYRLRHAGTLGIAYRILGLTGKTDVQPLLRILPDGCLILTDVTCYDQLYGKSPANSNHRRDGNEEFVLSDPSQSFFNPLYVKQHSYELLFYNVKL